MQLTKEVDEINQLKFKPKINETSNFIASQKPLANMTHNERFYYQAIEEKNTSLQQLNDFHQQIHESKFTFKPEINKVSQSLSAINSSFRLGNEKQQIYERVYHNKLALQMDVERSVMQECSFYPQTNISGNYTYVESNYDSVGKILDNAKVDKIKKQQLYRTGIKEKQSHELDGCTFKPQINPIEQYIINDLKSKDNVVLVNGYDKYMEFRSLHNKKQQEDLENKDKIFRIDKRYDHSKHAGYTVPQPFKLSQTNKKKIDAD